MSIVDFPQQGTIGASLKPKRYDIEIYQGDTFKFSLVFKDSTNAVINITGWTGLVQFKDIATSALEVTPTVTIDGPNGKATITIADTGVLDAGSYKYDVQFTDAGGSKRTYIGGKITVTEDVSE